VKIVADANIPFVKECFSSIGDVNILSADRITRAVVKNADILLVRSVTNVNSSLLASSKLKFVGTATIGFDHIDVDFLKTNNIGFASAPGSNANSVAEYVVAALLETAEKHKIDLNGKSIGIIGVGNVGSKVTEKVKALGMTTFLNDPPLYRQTHDEKYLPIEQLYDCDFITLHTPLIFEGIDKTYHLADVRFFDSLKKGVVFINTSRGSVVDSSALKNNVKNGKIKAAVLDVWENEPNIDTELLEMVDIATPHIAGYSLDGKIAGMIMVYNAACEFFGVRAEFGIASFLPQPAVKQLKINSKTQGRLSLIEAVRKIYDIKADDRKLRKLLNLSNDQQETYFRNLRKEYSVRREFQNTRLLLESTDRNAAKKFEGIGFKVEKSD